MKSIDRGAIYAVVGEKYLREARTSIRSLRNVHPDLPMLVMTVDTADLFDSILGDVTGVHRYDCSAYLATLGIDMSNPHEVSRALKVSVAELSPFDYSLFLDSDTFICLPVNQIFSCLEATDDAPALIVTNEPKAAHVITPGTSRPVATTLSTLSDPRIFNSGVFAFSKSLQNSGFAKSWQQTWLDQIRKKSNHEWARLSDQRALNKAIQENHPSYSVFSNTVWNAQCKILFELHKQNRWNDIHIIHCKVVHSLGSDPDSLLRNEYIKRFQLAPDIETNERSVKTLKGE